MKKLLLKVSLILFLATSYTHIGIGQTCFEANFANPVSVGYDGCTVTFENTSFPEDELTAYSWEFGDGAVSTEKDPTHYYGNSGEYLVKLTVTHQSGDTKTVEREINLAYCNNGSNNPSGNPTSFCQSFDVNIQGPSTIEAGSSTPFTVQTIGGTGPFTYSWSPVGVCADITTLNGPVTRITGKSGNCVGAQIDLTVNVVDANGNQCEATRTVTISLNTLNVGCSFRVRGKKEVDHELKFAQHWFNFGQIDCNEYYDGWWWWDFDDEDQPAPQQWIPGRAFHTYQKNGTKEVSVEMCRSYPNEHDCKTLDIKSNPELEVEIGPLGTKTRRHNLYSIVPSDRNIPTDLGEQKTFFLEVEHVPLPNQSYVDYYPVLWEFIRTYTDEDGIEHEIELHTWVDQMYPGNYANEWWRDYPVSYTPQGDDDWGCIDIRVTIDVHGGYEGNWVPFCDLATYGVNFKFSADILYSSDVFFNAGRLQVPHCIDDDLDGLRDYPLGLYEECVLDVKLHEMEITSIAKGYCDGYLTVEAQKGAVEFRSIPNGAPCSGSQKYVKYDWKAFSAIDAEIEITDEIFDFSDLDGETAKCVLLNRQSEYFESFGDQGEFYAMITITDWLGAKETHWQLITVDLPLRVEMPENITRCKGVPFTINNGESIVFGGTDIEFTWGGDAASYIIDPDNLNPTLEFPERLIGNIYTLTLIISDICGSSFEESTEISLNSVIADAGPQTITVCHSGWIGPSFYDYNFEQKLGPATATGGSGNYTYSWFPIDYLSDPNIADPIFVPPGTINPNDLDELEYYVEVTDEYGCSSTAGPVSFQQLPGYLDKPDAGPDQSICLESDVVIGNNQSEPYFAYDWSSNNTLFGGSSDANLNLTPEDNSVSGTYSYKVERYLIDGNTGVSTGCFQTDEVEVEVLQPWLYEGFESELVTMINDPGATLTTQAWSSSNNRIITNSENPNSGAGEQFSYQWLPSTGINTTQTSSDGYATQGSMAYPQGTTIGAYEMEVTDNNGCTETFFTNRILPFSYAAGGPQLRVETQPNRIICTGEEMCFDVELNTNYLPTPNNNPPLPHSIQVAYVAEFGQGKDNNGVLQFPEVIPKLSPQGGFNQCYLNASINYCSVPLTLYLVEGSQGVYIGQWCYTFQHPSQNQLRANNRVKFIADFPFVKEEEISFFVYPPLAPSGFVIKPPITVIDQSIYTAKNLTVGPDASYTSISPPSTKFVGGFSVDMLPEYNSDLFSFDAFIDGCMGTGNIFKPKDDPKTVESREKKEFEQTVEDIVKIDFTIFPNPFNNEIQLKYAVKSEDLAKVSIRVFSPTGRVIKNIISNREHTTGEYIETYNSDNLQPGLYFFELLVDEKRLVRKAVKIGNR